MDVLEHPASEATCAAFEDHFTSHDGVRLFYRAWFPGGGATAAGRAILLLHRGHEHSGRWDELVGALASPETAVFAWDARGHGRSPGERGDAEDFADYVRDLDCFARHVSTAHGIALENTAVVAHSVGAVVAATWVHDYAPPIRALVLATPAFRVKLYVPLAVPGLRLLQTVRPKAFIRSYVGGRLLTHDKEEAQRYDTDPAISRQISVRVLLGLQDTARRIVADAGAICTPTLVLTAGSDAVVRQAPQRRFFERLSSTHKAMETLAGFSHAIFHETGRRQVFALVREFVDAAFAREPESSDAYSKADAQGYTYREYVALRAPISLVSPSGLSFAMQRLGMGTLLRLSKGVRLGRKTGFDSGESLDYIYENQARGTSPLGRLIDRQYLDAIGWRGIRQRTINLRKTLDTAIENVRAASLPVQLLDVAAGPGRYLLETLQRCRSNGIPASSLLRDRSENSLTAGRVLAEKMGLGEQVSYEIGDAFDESNLSAIEPKPTVAVVSGLYELFPANSPVLASLRGLHAALEPGGWLIYTNQPWHPQVEMIARVLRNRDGKPWIMRRRTQGEMDALVRAADLKNKAWRSTTGESSRCHWLKRSSFPCTALPMLHFWSRLRACPWRAQLSAALWLALLGPLFFVVYGWCNAFTSHRPDVGSDYFDWERKIPFVPEMIIPYMSIDLLFAGSFFLCRDSKHLRTHAARIALAIALSAIGFLIFPLRYGWPRPTVGGWLGPIFAPLNALDQPYNLCPSMHISLRTILWRVYSQRLRPRPWLHALAWGWFALVGISTLLVYQHHVVDLVGGFLVALVCCHLFPEKLAAPRRALLPSAQNPIPNRLSCPPISSTRPLPPASLP